MIGGGLAREAVKQPISYPHESSACEGQELGGLKPP